MREESVGRAVHVGAVDDHPVMLTGIRTELTDIDPDLHFGRTAPTVDDLLLAGGGPYDVVLLDLRLGDGSRPFDNVTRVRTAGAEVLVYTDGLDNAAGCEALSAGALGIVLKDQSPAILADAVRTVAAGDTVVSARLAAVLESAAMPPTAALSERERQTLRLYALDLPSKSVARRMNITEKTAKEYLKRIRAKYAALGRRAYTKLDFTTGPSRTESSSRRQPLAHPEYETAASQRRPGRGPGARCSRPRSGHRLEPAPGRRRNASSGCHWRCVQRC